MDTAGLSKKMSELSSTGRKQFIFALNSEFKNSPLATNVLLGFILTGLEKMVEMEFACPCKPSLNAIITSAYFILPGVIASVIILCIHGCTFKDWKTSLYVGVVPFVMWVILLFLDGEYYACGKTSWSGRFVIVDKAAPHRWCEPHNTTLSMERMIQTQLWYFHSQIFGLSLCTLACAIFFAIYKCKTQPQEVARGPEEPEEMDNLTKTI